MNLYISDIGLLSKVKHFVSVTKMDGANMRLEEELKERSGKSVKCRAQEILRLEYLETLFMVVLLSNTEVKFAVVMSEKENEKFKIDEGKTFFLKNLSYKGEKMGIPLFKVSRQSVFRVSNTELLDCKIFNNVEINALKSLEVAEFYENQDNSENNSVASQEKSNDSPLLSLQEFSSFSPDEIQDHQYVEVVFFYYSKNERGDL